MSKKLKSILATALLIGHIPGAPGTWGSMAAAALFVAAGMPVGAAGFAVALGLVILGLWAASGAAASFGESDPAPVVIDEVAGMWLALAVGGARTAAAVAAAFVLFRLFDIAKPFPIRRLERLDGAAGIMADDIAAGLASGALVRLAVYVGILF